MQGYGTTQNQIIVATVRRYGMISVTLLGPDSGDIATFVPLLTKYFARKVTAPLVCNK